MGEQDPEATQGWEELQELGPGQSVAVRRPAFAKGLNEIGIRGGGKEKTDRREGRQQLSLDQLWHAVCDATGDDPPEPSSRT